MELKNNFIPLEGNNNTQIPFITPESNDSESMPTIENEFLKSAFQGITNNVEPSPDPKPDPKGKNFSNYIQLLSQSKNPEQDMRMMAKAYKGVVDFDEDNILRQFGGDKKKAEEAKKLYQYFQFVKIQEANNTLTSNPTVRNPTSNLTTNRIIPVATKQGFDTTTSSPTLELRPDVATNMLYQASNQFIGKDGKFTTGAIEEQIETVGLGDALLTQVDMFRAMFNPTSTEKVLRANDIYITDKEQEYFDKLKKSTVATEATNKEYFQALYNQGGEFKDNIDRFGDIDNFLKANDIDGKNIYKDAYGVGRYIIKEQQNISGEQANLIRTNKGAQYDKDFLESTGDAFQGAGQSIANLLKLPLEIKTAASSTSLAESFGQKDSDLYRQASKNSYQNSVANRISTISQLSEEDGFFGSPASFMENLGQPIFEMAIPALLSGGFSLGAKGLQATANLARMQGLGGAIELGAANFNRKVLAGAVANQFTALGMQSGLDQARAAGMYGEEALELATLYGLVTHYSQVAFGNPLVERIFGGAEKTAFQKSFLSTMKEEGSKFIPQLMKAGNTAEKQAVFNTMKKSMFEKASGVWRSFAQNKSALLDPVKEGVQEMAEGLGQTASNYFINKQAEYRGLEGRLDDEFSFDKLYDDGAAGFIISGLFGIGKFGIGKIRNLANGKANDIPYQRYIASAVASGQANALVEQIQELRSQGALGATGLDVLGNVISKGKIGAVSENDYIAAKAIEEINRIQSVYKRAKDENVKFAFADKNSRLSISQASNNERMAIATDIMSRLQERISFDITKNIIDSQGAILDIAQKENNLRGDKRLVGIKAPNVKEGETEKKMIQLANTEQEVGGIVEYDATKHEYVDEHAFEANLTPEERAYANLIEDLELSSTGNKEEAYISKEELDTILQGRENEIRDRYEQERRQERIREQEELQRNPLAVPNDSAISSIDKRERDELRALNKTKGSVVKLKLSNSKKGLGKVFQSMYNRNPLYREGLSIDKEKSFYKTNLKDLIQLGVSVPKDIRNLHLIESVEDKREIIEKEKDKYSNLSRERKDILDSYNALERLNDFDSKKLASVAKLYLDEYLKDVYGISPKQIEKISIMLEEAINTHKENKKEADRVNQDNSNANEANNQSILEEKETLKVQINNQLNSIGDEGLLSIYDESLLGTNEGTDALVESLELNEESPEEFVLLSLINSYKGLNNALVSNVATAAIEPKMIDVVMMGLTSDSIKKTLEDTKQDPTIEYNQDTINLYKDILTTLTILQNTKSQVEEIAKDEALRSLVGEVSLKEIEGNIKAAEELYEAIPEVMKDLIEFNTIASERVNIRIENDINEDVRYNTVVASWLIDLAPQLNEKLSAIIKNGSLNNKEKNSQLITLIYEAEEALSEKTIDGAIALTNPSEKSENRLVSEAKFGNREVVNKEPIPQYEKLYFLQQLKTLKRKTFNIHLSKAISLGGIVPSIEQQRAIYHIVASMMTGNNYNYLLGEGGVGKSTVVNLAVEVYASIMAEDNISTKVYATSSKPNIVDDLSKRKQDAPKGSILASGNYIVGQESVIAVEDADVIIIDEFSIFEDVEKRENLIKATKGKRVILVGDVAQISTESSYGAAMHNNEKAYVAPLLKSSFRTNILSLQSFQRDIRGIIFKEGVLSSLMADEANINPANIIYENTNNGKEGIVTSQSIYDIIQSYKDDSREDKIILVNDQLGRDTVLKTLPDAKIMTVKQAQGKEWDAVYYASTNQNSDFRISKNAMYVASTRARKLFSFNTSLASTPSKLSRLKPLSESLEKLQEVYRERINTAIAPEEVGSIVNKAIGAISVADNNENVEQEKEPIIEGVVVKSEQAEDIDIAFVSQKTQEQIELENLGNSIKSSLEEKIGNSNILKGDASIVVEVLDNELAVSIASNNLNQVISKTGFSNIQEAEVEQYANLILENIENSFYAFKNTIPNINAAFKKETIEEVVVVIEDDIELLQEENIIGEEFSVNDGEGFFSPTQEAINIRPSSELDILISDIESFSKEKDEESIDGEAKRISLLADNIINTLSKYVSEKGINLSEILVAGVEEKASQKGLTGAKRALFTAKARYNRIAVFEEQKAKDIDNFSLNDIYASGGTIMYYTGKKRLSSENVVLKMANVEGIPNRVIGVYEAGVMVAFIQVPIDKPTQKESFQRVQTLINSIESKAANGLNVKLPTLKLNAIRDYKGESVVRGNFEQVQNHLRDKGYEVHPVPVVYTKKEDEKVALLSLGGRSLRAGRAYILYGNSQADINAFLSTQTDEQAANIYKEGNIGFIRLEQEPLTFNELMDIIFTDKATKSDTAVDAISKKAVLNKTISTSLTGNRILTLRAAFHKNRANNSSYGLISPMVIAARAFSTSNLMQLSSYDEGFKKLVKTMSSPTFTSKILKLQKINEDSKNPNAFGHLFTSEVHDFLLYLKEYSKEDSKMNNEVFTQIFTNFSNAIGLYQLNPTIQLKEAKDKLIAGIALDKRGDISKYKFTSTSYQVQAPYSKIESNILDALMGEVENNKKAEEISPTANQVSEENKEQICNTPKSSKDTTIVSKSKNIDPDNFDDLF